jgi:nitrate/TMAO reductase-like tetraheme cytochrome c subunit
MRILGLQHKPNRFLRYRPTRWGWIILLAVVGLVGMAGFAEYSMQPEFCRSCHIMEPYFQAWHSSTHSTVPCADCHFEPGLRNTLKGKWEASSQAVKFVTGTYGSKPHAEVRDASCLREGCHEKRVLEGKVNWEVPTQRGTNITIRFDHTPHLTELRRGKSLRCVSCHSQIVQGQHIVVTLDTCFLCHFKGLKHGRDEEVLGGCRSCHDAPANDIRLTTGLFKHSEYVDNGVECQNCHADAVSGDGAVPKQVCWTCHNMPHDIARYGETSFMHQTHVSDHKVECASCHIQITHHLSAVTPGADGMLSQPGEHMLDQSGTCGQCHEKLHTASLDLYQGLGGRGVDPMPSAMYRAQVDCLACHQQRSNPSEVAAMAGQTFLGEQASCDHCHANKYAGRLTEWRETLAMQLQKAEQIHAQALPLLQAATLSGDQLLNLRRIMDDAEHNLRMVKLGHGVHNMTYATALLNVTINNCTQIIAALQPGDLQQAREGP